MTNLITSDQPFTDAERSLLARLAGAMIPAQGAHPGAAHPEILDAICGQLAAQQETVKVGLKHLAEQITGNPMDDELLLLLSGLRDGDPAFITLLESTLLTCYYQHPDVLTAIGVEPRPPYPGGRQVDDTDWSLLDPVRSRAPFYRET